METDWLRDFLAVAEHGGFPDVADETGLSQPALSRRIRALETWAGVQLFERTARQLKLTPAGEALRPVANDILASIRRARDVATEAAERAAGSVRIACTHLLASTFFPSWLAEMETALPQPFSVQLRVDNMIACERMMTRGEVSLLLCHHREGTSTMLSERSFRRHRLGQDELVPIAGRDVDGRPVHLLPRPGTKTPLLAYQESSGLGRILRESAVLDKYAEGLEPVFQSHAALTLAMLAVAGRGVAWIPLSLLKSNEHAAAAVEIGDARDRLPIEICLFRSLHRQSPAVETIWLLQ